MATTKPAKPMAVKSAVTKAGKRSTVVTFCICVLTVVDLSIAAGGTPSQQDHVVKLDMKCPRLGGVAIGEPMVGGVFRDSYKRHEFGQWEEDSTWCVRQEEPVLGFMGNVNVRVDGTGKVYGLEISDSIEINRDAEDITERLLGLLLQHQKVIVSELRLDERLIGTNCCSKVELRGMTAYDIFQDVVKFSDASASLYANYRRKSNSKGTITCELRLFGKASGRINQNIRNKPPKHYTKVDIGQLSGYRLGQYVDSDERHLDVKLDEPIFGFSKMRLGLTRKKKVWEMELVDNMEFATSDPYADIMREFLIYQKKVIEHYGYPSYLTGEDNVYYIEQHTLSCKNFSATQWISFKDGSIQIILSLTYMADKAAMLKTEIRAVNFGISKNDGD